MSALLNYLEAICPLSTLFLNYHMVTCPPFWITSRINVRHFELPLGFMSAILNYHEVILYVRSFELPHGFISGILNCHDATVQYMSAIMNYHLVLHPPLWITTWFYIRHFELPLGFISAILNYLVVMRKFAILNYHMISCPPLISIITLLDVRLFELPLSYVSTFWMFACKRVHYLEFILSGLLTLLAVFPYLSSYNAKTVYY